MIYYNTREELRTEYRAYVNKKYASLKESTRREYFGSSFTTESYDRGIDFWQAICSNELLQAYQEITKEGWINSTTLHSESIFTVNHWNEVKGIERLFDYVDKNPSWKERILAESSEVNFFMSKTIIENIDLTDEEIVKLLQEQIGPYKDRFELRIKTYRYLIGEPEIGLRLESDVLFLFLDNMKGKELDDALKRVKDYLIDTYERKFYTYYYLIQKLDEYSQERAASISFPKNFLDDYIVKIKYQLDKVLWLIFAEKEFAARGKWTNTYEDERFSRRLVALPVGATMVLVEEIEINDDLSKFFKKGVRVHRKGVVRENPRDGINIYIDWEEEEINRVWYHDTFSGDLSYVFPSYRGNKDFVDFIHNGVEQDIEGYIRKHGRKQSKVDIETDSELTPVTLFEEENNSYTKNDFLNEVFLDSIEYDRLVNLIDSKQNVILQGAPGVGKTYMAKRLAYSLIGAVDNEYVLQLQFHQSYSYEDLIMGYRPTESHFKLVQGPFYQFINKAIDDPENRHFIIIDEINRGNISKIFGELLMLIEADKRGSSHAIKLMYSDEDFYIPDNVYIIGMMNTADRSLALIDYALRRRFAFYTLKPAFDNHNFKQMVDNTKNRKLKHLVEGIKSINKEIREDDSLGAGFEIGHSYFTKEYEVKDSLVHNIIDFEIEPLLFEYWYDDEEKASSYIRMLKAKIND